MNGICGSPFADRSEEMIWIVSFGYKSYLFLLILVLRSSKSLAAFVNSSAAFNK